MNLLVKFYGNPDAHIIPFCHGVRTFDGLGKAGPGVTGRLSAVAKTSKTNSQDKTSPGASSTDWSRYGGAIPGARSPYLQPARFSQRCCRFCGCCCCKSRFCDMPWEYWRLGPIQQQRRQEKGEQWATRTSLCNLSCCNLATLHEVCSGFGLGVAASFRLIAQSHLGPCWSWSSATHPLLCACSLLTLVHSPQCHSRSSYRPPEASPAGQREVTPPRRCRLAFLSLGSYLRTVSSPLSSTPGWTPSQIEPRLLPPPQSHGLARNGANKPCGTGKHRGDGGRDTVSDGAPSHMALHVRFPGSQAPAPAASPE